MFVWVSIWKMLLKHQYIALFNAASSTAGEVCCWARWFIHLWNVTHWEAAEAKWSFALWDTLSKAIFLPFLKKREKTGEKMKALKNSPFRNDNKISITDSSEVLLEMSHYKNRFSNLSSVKGKKTPPTSVFTVCWCWRLFLLVKSHHLTKESMKPTTNKLVHQ